MASFLLDGETYEYLKQDPGHRAEDARSWTYGNSPKVLAGLSLAAEQTVDVYAVPERWNPSHILVSWADDEDHAHWAWVSAGNVRPRHRFGVGHQRVPALPREPAPHSVGQSAS